jgi:hypothetical protein
MFCDRLVHDDDNDQDEFLNQYQQEEQFFSYFTFIMDK